MAQIAEWERLRLAIEDPAKAPMKIPEIVAEEIRQFTKSEGYKVMQMAERYYRNRSDVQNKKNDVANRSNTKIEHPLVKKLVDQKADYLLAKPFTVKTDSGSYGKALNELFDAGFRKKVKAWGRNAVKSGVAYLQPYFEEGALQWKRLHPAQVVPIWADEEKTRLDGFIRFNERTEYQGSQKGSRLLAELWTKNGVQRFQGVLTTAGAAGGNGSLEVDKSFGTEANGYMESHFVLGDKPFNFEEVPLVWLRYNEEELPLAYYIKELVDDINWQASVTADVLRDIAKFVYVLRGYGGADLAEFIKDLQEHLAIKVDGDGGVDKLQAEMNIDAVMAFLDKNRRDAIYFASGVDTKDPELGNASGSSIQFRYMDLDNDCQGLAAEMQASFGRMKLFVDVYFQAMGKGDFSRESFEIVFNMDMPVNETDVINNVNTSAGVLSQKTLLENHPWVQDAEAEMEQREQEKAKAMEQFGAGLFEASMGVEPLAKKGQPPEGAGGDAG